ncbi:MAG: 1-acyl-sn-glycerol-3-phosphate acyltransferase [Spirochaetales bacterium]|nr:1-acyl-sn-glycerol-3-phosphate acyltransferase [Spirochaetales bacterium]
MLGPIREVYADRGRTMVAASGQPRVVTTENVYQEANTDNRGLIDQILDELVLPGSEIIGVENLVQLHKRSCSGESCLILMEHYSNFDIPTLCHLLGRQHQSEVAEAIVAMAGMKLNEDSGFVKAFSEAYTRIVIYPTRSLDSISDPTLLEEERRRSKRLNMAATRQMIRLKHTGRMILLFPSGTRYRPGKPDTKRGVKEVDSYIKSFDAMIFVAIAGNVLRIHPTGDMSRDLATKDMMIMQASEPVSCEEFRATARDFTPEGIDPKQHVADTVMVKLEEIHTSAEELRQDRLKRCE